MPTTEVFPTARMWYCQFIHESHVKLTMTTTMTLTIFFIMLSLKDESVFLFRRSRGFFIRSMCLYSIFFVSNLKLFRSFWSLLSESRVVTNLLGDVQTGRKWQSGLNWVWRIICQLRYVGRVVFYAERVSDGTCTAGGVRKRPFILIPCQLWRQFCIHNPPTFGCGNLVFALCCSFLPSER